jgi:hypothetical protein
VKLKMIVLALAAAAVTASAAIASPPQGKGHGKPATTGSGCKPQVAVILTGTVATAPGATPVLPFALSVNVTHSNHHGANYAKATQPITVTVTSDTKIRREGAKTLSALLAGDRVTIHARACKADLANPATATATLTATMVTAHEAKS